MFKCATDLPCRVECLAVERDAWLIVDDWSRLTRHEASVAEITRLLPDPSRILDAKTGTNLDEAVKAGEVARNEVVGKEIGRRTKEGMQKLRDQGAVFGNPNIKAVQEKGAAGVSDKAARLGDASEAVVAPQFSRSRLAALATVPDRIQRRSHPGLADLKQALGLFQTTQDRLLFKDEFLREAVGLAAQFTPGLV